MISLDWIQKPTIQLSCTIYMMTRRVIHKKSLLLHVSQYTLQCPISYRSLTMGLASITTLLTFLRTCHNIVVVWLLTLRTNVKGFHVNRIIYSTFDFGKISNINFWKHMTKTFYLCHFQSGWDVSRNTRFNLYC